MINNFHKKYELTGFLMENTNLKNAQEPVFECFNLFNNKLLDAVRTEGERRGSLKTFDEPITLKTVFIFSFRLFLYHPLPGISQD